MVESKLLMSTVEVITAKPMLESGPIAVFDSESTLSIASEGTILPSFNL